MKWVLDCWINRHMKLKSKIDETFIANNNWVSFKQSIKDKELTLRILDGKVKVEGSLKVRCDIQRLYIHFKYYRKSLTSMFTNKRMWLLSLQLLARFNLLVLFPQIGYLKFCHFEWLVCPTPPNLLEKSFIT